MTLEEHAVAAKTDRRAMNALIVRCEPFVRRRVYALARLARDRDSMLQVARLGVCRAAEKFDRARGILFVTYASWWIGAYVQKERDRERGEGHVRTKGVNRAPPETLRLRWMDAPGRPDQDGNATTLADLLADETTTPDVVLIQHEKSERVRSLLPEMLSNSSRPAKWRGLFRTVLEERLLSDSPLTLLEIGDRHGVSREWVRQVESKLLKRGRKLFAQEAA